MKIVAVEPIGISSQMLQQTTKMFAELGHELVWYQDRKEDEATLIERMKDADIAIVSNIKLSRNVISQCSRLKMLSIAFTGVDHVDLACCQEQGITVCNASGYATQAVAELAIGLMIDVYRKITEMDASTRKEGTRNNYLGKQLSGKVVGIVGTGAIGTQTALLAQAFGCKVIAWSRHPKQDLIERGIVYVSIDELLATADIISLHIPLNAETKHFINKERLQKCRPTAILINTARGNVVDIDALAQALNEGRLAGAGIDVFEKEPPLADNHPLLTAKNCVLTPHVGYATMEAFGDRIDIVLDNIKHYLKQEVINKVV